MDINIDTIAKSITDKLEKYKNKENLNWITVYTNEINSIKEIKKEEKHLLLIRIVREISKRGYTIQDNPFKLIK